MLQSFIVYTLLFIFMYFLSIISTNKRIYKKSSLDIYIFTSIFIFCIIYGIRYNVGMDHYDYIKYYEEYRIYGTSRDFEYAYRYLSIILGKLNAHFSIFFGCCAFLQIVFFYKSFENDKKIIPFAIFVLFTGGYFLSWMNGIRQNIAVCIFIYSLNFLSKKDLIGYIICIFFAYLFHQSALVLLIFSIYVYKDIYIYYSIKRQFLIYIISFILGKYYLEIFWVQFSSLFSRFNYAIYTQDFEDIYVIKSNSGIGYILGLISNIIIISYSNKIRKHYKSKILNISYTLLFMSFIISNIFSGIHTIQRLNLYFSSMKLLVLPYLLYYLQKSIIISDRKIYISLIAIYIILYLSYIYKGDENVTTYNFFWEKI